MSMDLLQVDLLPPESLSDQAAWLLLSDEPEALRIPVNAVGADKLFDVFAKLDGIHTSRMLDWLEKLPEQQVVVWRADGLSAD